MSLRMYPTSGRAAAVAVVVVVVSVAVLAAGGPHPLVPARWLPLRLGRELMEAKWLDATQDGMRVTGRVVDATAGAPVPAAAVMVQGTAIGQNTTESGTFSFRVPAHATSITVRRIGYLAQTVPLRPGKAEYTIALQKDALRLEAQVVTGAATTVASENAANAVRTDGPTFDAVERAGRMEPLTPPTFGGIAGAMSPAPTLRSPEDAGRGRLVDDAAVGVTGDAARMIVRSGGASIEVTSIDSAVPRVRALAAMIDGFVANSSVQAGHDQVRTATLEVKVPAPAFDRLLSGLSPLGRVEYVNVSAEDVGEEYVDVEARIANDHRLEARLIELLATRTGKLRDVLDVEQELARVREEIERYEGRLRYLRTHADLSTLSITMHEPLPILDHVGPNPLVAAARQAWRNFIALLAFAIASLGVVTPLAAVGGVLWWMLRPAKGASGAGNPA